MDRIKELSVVGFFCFCSFCVWVIVAGRTISMALEFYGLPKMPFSQSIVLPIAIKILMTKSEAFSKRLSWEQRLGNSFVSVFKALLLYFLLAMVIKWNAYV